MHPVAFFTWNAQTFSERFRRRGLIFLMAALRPFLYSTNRMFATRVVHTALRGVTRDRLDLLGEEYFQYKLKPQLKTHGAEQVRELVSAGADVVLVSQGLEHVMKPLAQHLGVKRVVANRLEFRDGVATGRLLEPVIRPRGAFARIREQSPDGRRAPKTLARQLDITLEELRAAAIGSGPGIDGAGTSDCAFRRAATGGGIFGPAGVGGQARDADRRDRIYWEGLAGEHADGIAGDRADLSADPAAEIESGAAAV